MAKKRIGNIIAYSILTFFLTLFISVAILEKLFILPILIGFGILALLLIIGYIHVKKKPMHKRYDFLKHLDVILATIIGAIITFILSVNLNLGAVIGASIVGVMAVYICQLRKSVKDLAPPAYCGAFVGMVSPLILPNLLLVALGGAIAGLMYSISHEVYTGIGGKLGTMAFIGVTIAVLLSAIIGVII